MYWCIDHVILNHSHPSCMLFATCPHVPASVFSKNPTVKQYFMKSFNVPIAALISKCYPLFQVLNNYYATIVKCCRIQM